MTNTQRLDELSKAVAALERRADRADGADERVERRMQDFDPILRDWSKTQDRLDKLEKAGDQWATRAWNLGEKLLIAVVAAALGYYLKR